jgi:hypothetical protein
MLNALQGADIEGVLGAAIAGVLALALAWASFSALAFSSAARWLSVTISRSCAIFASTSGTVRFFRIGLRREISASASSPPLS